MTERKEALYYEKLKDDRVWCRLCPHECKISAGQRGLCRARGNIEGTLVSHTYGRVSAVAMDPMEKKPLYHFYPGTRILSLGTIGCNFKCSFCQNYHIAQPENHSHPESQTQPVNEEQILRLCRQEEDCIGVAYTYNEPSIWYEFVSDTARYMTEAGYKNVLVTNGYMSEEPLKALLPYIDAMNIDVKAFTEEYYKEVCGGSLAYVKNTVEKAAEKAHIEITTLIVPGCNDSEEEMEALAKWLASVNPSIPLHLSRYFPMYKMDEEPTPIETLERLKKVAEGRLEYVYLGNVQGSKYKNTYCPACKALLIERGYNTRCHNLEAGKCRVCGKEIYIQGV